MVETELREWLEMLVDREGSDLHLKVGSPPLVRLDGRLVRLEAASLTVEQLEHLAHGLIRADLREEFGQFGEADFAYSLSGLGRFRVSAFRQRGSIAMVLRRVRFGALSVAELGLPPVVTRLAEEPRGMVLVTGPTGSGKTTTLAAMIDHINSRMEGHILTIEDPIEVLHADKRCSINQRELRVDTTNLPRAVRAAMRQDPDVLLIGEMRDAETIAAAIATAETGHLVLSSLHTNDAAEAVNRCVDMFPPFQQRQIRMSLANLLRGVISQRLVRRADGRGRVAVIEVMVTTGRVAEAIIRDERTDDLAEIIREGSYYGMQTFDQHLLALIKDGVIALDDGIPIASSPNDLRVSLRSSGLVA